MKNKPDSAVRDVRSAVVEALGEALLGLAWEGDALALANWRRHGSRVPCPEPQSSPAAPWKMTHVLLCHPRQETSRAGECRSDCPFLEGWMDEVAFGLFNTYVAPRWPEPDHAARAAHDVRQERYSATEPPEHRSIVKQWALGREAAQVLLRFFESCTSYEDYEAQLRPRAALSQLVALSFQIQAATSSPPGLRRIVNSCLLSAQCGITFLGAPARVELLYLLTQRFVDINVWMTRMEALWRRYPT